MATITGKWIWNSTINPPTYLSLSVSGSQSTLQNVTFTAVRYDGTVSVKRITVRKYGYTATKYEYGYNAEDGINIVYNEDGWNGNYQNELDFGDTPQTVDDDFYTWFTANARHMGETSSINYNGNILAELEQGQTATLDCKGRKAVTAISVVFGSYGGYIIHNGKTDVVHDLKTATLLCSDKKMLTNVVIHNGISAGDVIESGSHALYNGVRLPTIPIVHEYPYAWIRNNTQTGYYDLIMATGKWFLSATDTLNHNDSNACKWYRVQTATAESANAWVYNQDIVSSGWGCESGRDLVWSNHDIPSGSADATDIYFEGTDPGL